MPRPRGFRHIEFSPEFTFFKPQGIPLTALASVDLSLDEIEALRLKYLVGHDNTSGAAQMQISTTTFQRLVVSSLKKVTEALVTGKAIKLHKVIDFNFPGMQRGYGRGRRMRMGHGRNAI